MLRLCFGRRTSNVIYVLPKIEREDVTLGIMARATCCEGVGIPLKGAMMISAINCEEDFRGAAVGVGGRTWDKNKY